MVLQRFVGVDLAWGQRNRTGLAVLDETGRLLEATDRRTDDDIVDWLADHAAGPSLVAIDAPLIVTNPTGSRPCETALSAVFGRYDAGTHPSNTGRPWFADGTRGARLAARLGLDTDPQSASTRRAIEVYPHPATVVIFGLDRTIKYKHKPGRSFGDLHAASTNMLSLLESLANADPPLHVLDSPHWTAIRAAVATATRKSQLRAVEDRIDAVLCGYVALFAARRPTHTTVYGDGDTGYIVTPTLPAGHPPPAARLRSSPPVAPHDASVRLAARSMASQRTRGSATRSA